jgi:large subunit ribosomal protein L10
MAISKEKKQEVLAKLEAARASAATLVFVKFTGLTGKDTTAMRKTMREQGVGLLVAKKTLIGRVMNAAGYEGSMPEIPGEVALAYGADQIMPAQQVREFEKKFKDSVSILGGVFAGAFKDKAEMTVIASIPGMDALRGMFAQLVNSPRQRFAVVLSEVAKTKTS